MIRPSGFVNWRLWKLGFYAPTETRNEDLILLVLNFPRQGPKGMELSQGLGLELLEVMMVFVQDHNAEEWRIDEIISDENKRQFLNM